MTRAARYQPRHLAPPWEPGWGEQYGGLRSDQFVDFWRDLQDVPGARVMPSPDSARTRPPINDTTEDD
jgi:hypothetical protein